MNFYSHMHQNDNMIIITVEIELKTEYLEKQQQHIICCEKYLTGFYDAVIVIKYILFFNKYTWHNYFMTSVFLEYYSTG